MPTFIIPTFFALFYGGFTAIFGSWPFFQRYRPPKNVQGNDLYIGIKKTAKILGGKKKSAVKKLVVSHFLETFFLPIRYVGLHVKKLR